MRDPWRMNTSSVDLIRLLQHFLRTKLDTVPAALAFVLDQMNLAPGFLDLILV
jgi:hypothetical protein